jgi:hypothetical protein
MLIYQIKETASWNRFCRIFSVATKTVPKSVYKTLDGWLFLVERGAKKRLTGGNPLHVRSGRLRTSVTHIIYDRTPIIEGVVGTNVFYGLIHELGGRFMIPAYSRILKQNASGSAPANSSIGAGSAMIGEHFATYKKRAWLEPSVVEQREKLRQMLEKVGLILEG